MLGDAAQADPGSDAVPAAAANAQEVRAQRTLDDERERRDRDRVQQMVDEAEERRRARAAEEQRRQRRIGQSAAPQWALIGSGIAALLLGAAGVGLTIALSGNHNPRTGYNSYDSFVSATSSFVALVPGVMGGAVFLGGAVMIGLGANPRAPRPPRLPRPYRVR